jgi:N-acetyl-gamma-glutamyl-phosphate reductase
VYKVFIDGKQGSTGLRIYERIVGAADITLLTLSEAERKDPQARKEKLLEADISFLCLPDDAAREAVSFVEGGGARIIDASSAHRTGHGFAYGFPELSAAHRVKIEYGMRTAVPGCHASGYIALVYPLVNAGALGKDALLSVTSLTGYSGGGKKMINEYWEDDRADIYDSPRHYAPGQTHKHLPEMLSYTGLTAAPVMNPIVADFYAGMLVSVPLHVRQLQNISSLGALQAIYENHYAGQEMVRVLPANAHSGFIHAGALAGKDYMEVFFCGNDERITLYARYDNLGKGSSGAALQCMNIMLGRPETEGLAL